MARRSTLASFVVASSLVACSRAPASEGAGGAATNDATDATGSTAVATTSSAGGASTTVASTGAGAGATTAVTTSTSASTGSGMGGGVSIIVEPSDKAQALVDALNAATKSIHMVMYLFSSNAVEKALEDAHAKGLEVKVILNKTFPDNESNQQIFNQLQQAGIDVVWAPSTYALTHEKSFVIDGATAWIMTMNATQTSPTSNREYLAVDTIPADVAEVEALFEADFANQSITPKGNLLVSPGYSRPGLVNLISLVKSQVDVEVEELSDYMVVDELATVAQKGVVVNIVLAKDSSPSSSQVMAVSQLKTAGAHVVETANPYIHAKAIVVDGQYAFIGSENFTTQSLQYNREVGVQFGTPSEVAKVKSAIDTDFANGTPQ